MQRCKKIILSSQILVHDTLQPLAEPVSLSFPGSERRPVVGVTSVSPAPSHGLPWPGVLALTLGSLWFWEHNTQVSQEGYKF